MSSCHTNKVCGRDYDVLSCFADLAEYRGAEADHESGDWTDQLEERGNQVQEERAVPRCP